MFELVKMWALIEALGLLCLPITVTVFHNLPDRGWAFSKSLGMAIFAFAVWLPLMCFHTLPYSQAFLWGVGLILTGGSIGGFLLTQHTIRKVVSRNLSYVLSTELVFLGMVALLGFLRQFRPDIRSWETFMDEGIIAGIMRSPHLPPNDVWYAGLSINYYYYAHFTIATLAKTIGQSPSIVFNTGISIFFGLTAVNLFGISSNIVAWAKHTRPQLKRRKQESKQPVQSPASFPPLLGAIPFGLCSLAMGVLFGNLASASQWWTDRTAGLGVYEWFSPSRVIPSTINEFPAFSFLLSDFHAHVLTLAFTILAIGVAFNFFLEQDGKGFRAFGKKWQQPWTLFASALILGQLFAMNGWDYPTYLALALVCLLLQQWLAHGSRFSINLVSDFLTSGVALAALSYFLFVPFYLNFISPAQGLGPVNAQSRSSLRDELAIYGLFAFIFITFLLICFFRTRPATVRMAPVDILPEPRSEGAIENEDFEAGQSAGEETEVLASAENQDQDGDEPSGMGWLDMRFIGLLVTLIAVIVVLLVFKNGATLAIMGALATLAAILTIYHLQERGRSFLLLLGAVSFALIAFCEVVYLKDVFAEGDFFRMNTVFKFYFQVWALLSVACGSGLFFIIERFWLSNRERQPKRILPWFRIGMTIPWAIALALLVLASLIYPLMAPSARLSTYNAQKNTMAMNPGWNLDGMTYLQNCRPPDIYPGMDSDPSTFCGYDVTHDYAAIRWINAHIQGDPIIVEAADAANEDYKLYTLVSSFTGLPTIMGWPGHEMQWRANWLKNSLNSNSFNQRLSDITTIYTSPDPQTILRLMHQYNAEYLYIGAIEHMAYPQVDLARFTSFMQTVYNKDGVAIYKVPA